MVSSSSVAVEPVPAPASTHAAAGLTPLPTARAATVAAIAGIAWWSAFDPVRVRPLAVVAVAALCWAVRDQPLRRAAWLAALTGVVFYVPHLAWARVVGTNAWLVLAATQILFTAGLGVVLRLVGGLRAWPVWSAAAWVLYEAVRGRVPLGGFTWGRLAFSQDEGPFTPWASLGGAPGVTAAVALVGSLLAYAVVSSVSRRPRWRRAVATGLLAGGCLVAAGPLVRDGTTPESTSTVAVVQGNVPRIGLDAFSQRRRVTQNHLDATRRLAADVAAGRVAEPDLVVWPENATDIDPRSDDVVADTLTEAARLAGGPILVGAVLDRPDGRVENAGIIWTPDGRLEQRYVKRHLVPYGEYVPLRSVLEPIFDRLALIPRDFVPGRRPGVLRLRGHDVGVVICFEVSYDGIVRDAVRGGGDLLVVQTNNATYGRTPQPHQQFAMTRLRAVEHGRAVAIASTSGISALIRPDGTIVEKSDEFTAETLVAELPLTSSRTLATRLGDAPELAACLLAAAGVLLAIRRRRAGGTTPAASGESGLGAADDPGTP